MAHSAQRRQETDFSLAVHRDGDRAMPMVKIDEDYVPLARLAPDLDDGSATDLMCLLKDWERSRARLHEISAAVRGGTLQVTPILVRPSFGNLVTPGQVICAGSNFYDHLSEDMGITNFDKGATDPMFFLKRPRNLVPAGSLLPFPRNVLQLDWEVELVVVFGREGHDISASDAAAYIAGYTIGIDLSARDWQFAPRHPRQFDLVGGKSFDNSAPVGPVMLPADAVDPADLFMKLSVNDKIWQNSTTRKMIWSVGELVEAYTRHSTVEPGDLMFTGSPAGVGWASGTYLVPGDRIVAEIEGIEQLEIRLADDT